MLVSTRTQTMALLAVLIIAPLSGCLSGDNSSQIDCNEQEYWIDISEDSPYPGLGCESGPSKSILDLNRREVAIFTPLVVLVLWMGIYPEYFLGFMHVSANNLVENFEIAHGLQLAVAAP